MQNVIDIAKMCLTLLSFFYASWSDYKTREVSNKVWIILAPLAFALTFTELFLLDFGFSLLPYYGLCFGLTSAFAIILFYSGGFGGADSKALMCLALALPFYPEIFQPLTGTPSPISKIFFPITVFSNAVLLAAATAIYLLFYNIGWHWKTGKRLFEGYKASFGKKILVLLTGYKVSIGKLKEKWHIYPMEDLEENTLKRTLIVVPKDEGRDAIVQRLAKAVEEGKIDDKVWATPGLPMLIFITAGLILALILDNIIWVCIRFLIG